MRYTSDDKLGIIQYMWMPTKHSVFVLNTYIRLISVGYVMYVHLCDELYIHRMYIECMQKYY